MRKSLIALSMLVVSFAPGRAEEPLPVASIVAEFNADPNGARDKYKGKKVTFELEVQRRVTDNNKVYHQAVVKDLPKKQHVVFRLPKLYRATDKLIITATLKHSTWEKDEKWLYFDPCDVDKEVKVLPPIYNSTKLLQMYIKSPKKTAEQFVGKPIDISGVVRFVNGGEIVLEYIPLTDASGRVQKDDLGFEYLGRSLFTVKFKDNSADGLQKGAEVELRGVVESMQAGAIVIKDATVVK